MKIWEVFENVGQVRFYWFATKAEAIAHKRAFEADEREEVRKARDEGRRHSRGDCEIRSIDVAPTREGIARALNDVITMTCFNEG